MNTIKITNQATCPLCTGPLRRHTEGESGLQLEWKVCYFCDAEFGPPWREHQWSEPASEPDLLYFHTRKVVKVAA